MYDCRIEKLQFNTKKNYLSFVISWNVSGSTLVSYFALKICQKVGQKASWFSLSTGLEKCLKKQKKGFYQGHSVNLRTETRVLFFGRNLFF